MVGAGPLALGSVLYGDADDDGADAHWQQGLYLSRQLHDHLGDAPLRIAAEHIDRAFERSAIPIEIEIESDPIDFGSSGEEPPGCGSTIFDQWLDTDLPDRNSNLCLIYHSGGGCAEVAGARSVAGASPLEDVEHEFERNWSRVGQSIHSILHEIAHNAGYSHDMATGEVETRDGQYVVTPATSTLSGETEGACGGHHPQIETSKQEFRHYYSECTAGLFRDLIAD